MIAGSDSGGGAGIQADLRAATDHGVFGTTAITAVTAQDTTGVHRVDVLPPEAVVAQAGVVLADLRPRAIKLGMLATAAIADAVATLLAGPAAGVPVVLDPVMVSTSGHRLLDEDAVAVVRERLVPRATVVTPNLPEAALLAGVDDREGLVRWAEEQAAAVLITGGDEETEDVLDTLVIDGRRVDHRAPRLAGGPFHGTGCTLASAVAARIARGEGVEAAVEGGIAYVRRRLERAWRPGAGAAVGGFV